MAAFLPRARTCLLAIALAAIASNAAFAQRDASDETELPAGVRRDDLRSPFWRRVREPSRARADRHFRRGLVFFVRAEEQPTLPRRVAVMRSAVLRFQRAAALAPNHREALFYLGRTLAALEALNGDEAGDEAALEALERLRELDPTYRTDVVGFELGLLYTRRGRYEEAIEAYEAGIAGALSQGEATSIAHSNLAEVRMMSGDLLGAVADYERAIRLATQSGRSAQSLGLPLFGLAVALDRLGEREEARRRATQAVAASGGTTLMLRAEGVFYDPESEVFYYEGLGQEAIAESSQGEARGSALESARAAWTTYLRLAARDDRWRQSAEDHLREVETALGR
ncbi:MAG: tetratricopeptide repeat protein [Myxococcota bacterium]